MYSIGRVCIKLAGRDAGRECVIVDILDDKFVLIDGNVRRRKCNIIHLEPTKMTIELKKNASHNDIAKEFEKQNMAIWKTTAKKAAAKPVKVRGKKITEVVGEKKRKKEKKTVKEAVIVEEKKTKSDKLKADKRPEAKPDEKKAPKKKVTKE